jgi:predicted DNA-binding transcriptional regulator AlpA
MLPEKSSPPDRAVREPERLRITGVPTSTWYPLQRAGLAPKPFPVSAHTVAWSFNELVGWVEAQKAKRIDTWQPLGDAAAKVIDKVKSASGDSRQGSGTDAATHGEENEPSQTPQGEQARA